MKQNKPMVLIACDYMRLRVPEEQIARYNAYLWEIHTPGENTAEEIEELKRELLGLDRKELFDSEIYAPWCSKSNKICSEVMPKLFRQNMDYIPVSFITNNLDNVLKCPDSRLLNAQYLDNLIIGRLDTDYLKD